MPDDWPQHGADLDAVEQLKPTPPRQRAERTVVKVMAPAMDAKQLERMRANVEQFQTEDFKKAEA